MVDDFVGDAAEQKLLLARKPLPADDDRTIDPFFPLGQNALGLGGNFCSGSIA
jgi:hypothetical protein